MRSPNRKITFLFRITSQNLIILIEHLTYVVSVGCIDKRGSDSCVFFTFRGGCWLAKTHPNNAFLHLTDSLTFHAIIQSIAFKREFCIQFSAVSSKLSNSFATMFVKFLFETWMPETLSLVNVAPSFLLQVSQRSNWSFSLSTLSLCPFAALPIIPSPSNFSHWPRSLLHCCSVFWAETKIVFNEWSPFNAKSNYLEQNVNKTEFSKITFNHQNR